jgi:hypothetical protein
MTRSTTKAGCARLLVIVENVSRLGCIGDGGRTKTDEQSEMHGYFTREKGKKTLHKSSFVTRWKMERR